MAELDKLKRRIIRLVERKLIVEKKSYEDVWKELKAETGFDCEVLWKGMRALTLKKIRRLLPASDLTESIPPVAQMSLTDWLLFDRVLVHEDIDLIGQDVKNQNDPKPLIELMYIVHTLNIEGKSGDALVDAWIKATITYNGSRRRCSPMLLQRRWHQLKTATRNNFYNFWFSYRGSCKLLLRAKNQYMPSKLQMAIAQRYAHVITKPYMDWNECIQRKLVIFPDDFEKKMQIPQEILKDSDLQPDIMLLEPNIETIEINDGDSGTEKDQEDSTCSQNSISQTSKHIGRHTTIKTEPVDEEETKKPTIFSLSEQLLKRNEQLLLNMDIVDVQVINNDKLVDCISTNNYNSTSINIKSTYVTDNNSDDDIIEVTDNIDIPSTETSQLGIKKYRFDSNIENIIEKDSEIIQIETDVCLSSSKDFEAHMVMPQITSIFGNVNDDTDVLAQLSNLTTNKTINDFTSVVPVDKESENIDANKQTDLEMAINEKLGSYLGKIKKTFLSEGRTNKLNSVSIKKAEAKETIENIPQMNSEHPFPDLPAGLTFVDGGIELIDDGIEFIDDEIDLHKDDDTTAQAIDLCDSTDEENDDTEKFDMKLLMDPVVYTTKLDDMKVFKNKCIQYTIDKKVLYSAVIESKPKSARCVDTLKIKRNDNAGYRIIENNDELYSHESSDNEESIVESKRVKLSSPLLQKPKCRSYNSIQLCKNPDFNTRLKRLTVGFLSSMRNRSLLRTIKPMTIDISNTFETKLVNGTMYLKSSDTTCNIKMKDDLTEKTSAVMPSAMPAQTLIDHTQVNLQDIFPSQGNKTNNTKPNDSSFPQRSKAINLPDIENIRLMNQHLFTAEITPMRVQTASGYCKPPVQLVPSSSHYELVTTSPSSLITTEAPNITKTLNLHDSSIIYVPQHSLISHLTSNESSVSNKLSSFPSCSSDKEPIKLSTQKHRKTPLPSWLSKPFFPKGLKVDRGLLTIDTLKKMLGVMKEGKRISENFKDAMLASVIREIELQHLKKEDSSPNQKPEKKKSPEENRPVPLLVKIPTAKKHCDKRKISTPNKHCNAPKIPAASNDFNVKMNAKEMPKITPNKPKPKPNIPPCTDKTQEIVKEKEKYCCWAKKKLNDPSSRASHQCLNICLCCCRKEFVTHCTEQSAKMKQLNINRFQNISNLGHTSPIFLGKNNILLTNAPLPKEMSILPVLQKKISTDIPVPQGVQIILLPNGQLSYTVEQGVKLTKEEFATLPAILEAARQQLSPSTMNTSDTKSDDVYHIEDAEITHTSELSSNSVQDDGKAMSILPALLKKVTTDLVVPKGVQIVLLSNGEMSYTLEAGVKLTIEELATLTAILEAARQQLSPPIKKASVIKSDDVCHIQNSKDNLTGGNIAEEVKISNVVTLLNHDNIETNQTDSQVSDIKMQNIQPITFPDKEVKKHSDRQFSKTGTELIYLPLRTKDDGKKIKNANCDIPFKSSVILNEDLTPTDNSRKNQDDKKVKGVNSGILLKSYTTSNQSIPNDTSNIQDGKKVMEDNIDINLESNKRIPTTDQPSKNQYDKLVKGDNNSNNAITIQNKKLVEGDSRCIPTQYNTASNKGVTTTDDAIKFPEEEKSIAVDNTPLHTYKSNLLSDLMEISGISSEDKTFVTKEFQCTKPPHTSPTVPPLIPLIKTPTAPQTPPRYLQIAANAPPIITTSPSSDIQELCSITSYAHLKYAFEKNANFFKLDLQSGAVLPIKVSLKKDLTASAFNTIAQKPLPQFIDLTDEQDTPDKLVSETENNVELTSLVTTEPVRPLRLFRSTNILQRKRANIALKEVPKPNTSQEGCGQQKKQTLDKTSTRMETEAGNYDIKDSISHNGDLLWEDDSSEYDDEPLASLVKRRRQVQDTPEKDKGIDLFDMEGVIPANIISGLPQSSSVVSDQQNENTQDVQGTEDEKQDFNDIEDKQDGKDIQSAQEEQNTRNVKNGQHINDTESGQEEQDVEEDLQEGQVAKDPQDADDEQDMEDGQDVDDGRNMEDDQDNCILGF